ncbi:MAG: hypothetical protein GWN84_11030 [Gammaproteobacteria bacterium]|nr:hypothetical protein [Gammaproteobacteria bacterium]NIR83397.1 hypothetical protein [Gammaproteobacteria bacterium]NIR91319.1 hypothetical protein [Gammaproteobacteria bacterium]NIU04559.1 hypothetical protein [Gammaproteobacteria bacterium]NIV51601.1 hypothetical protein [Gammaproteobacteria bacterium]
MSESKSYVRSESLDPGALERAGWRNAELIWEQIQETAAELNATGAWEEAAELWEGALEIAQEHFRHDDPRLATSLANHGLAARRSGRDPAALFDEALSVWDSAQAWIAGLRPERRARSSLFHLRLQTKHRGAYDRFSRQRYAELAAEGRAALLACRDDTEREDDRLARWVREGRQGGLTDARKLMAAAWLIAPAR